MNDNWRIIDTIAKVKKLEWEVPGAYFWYIADDEESRDEQIYSAYTAFECWNEASLQGKAYDYFLANAVERYSVF